jgi:2-(1,2-epoxy-1,2-dihydrophenyl)acetyl-CoA isomerase
MELETLQYEVAEGVCHITLDREKAANAIDLQMSKDLMNAALAAEASDDVRAVLIAAKGRMFCAGGDLSSFAGAGDAMPTLVREMTVYLHNAISVFARMDAPVIAAVGGTAAGAGFSLVCSTDLAICGESAKFTMAYTGAGLTPDGSSTYFMPRLIGTRRTLELMITNRVLRANEALDWGIVNQVVPDDQLADTARGLARKLASGATGAFGVTKRLLLSSSSETLESQMELEGRAISEAGRTADAAEGIRAFFDKRPAKFSGR